jgi:hypothetical protein
MRRYLKYLRAIPTEAAAVGCPTKIPSVRLSDNLKFPSPLRGCVTMSFRGGGREILILEVLSI